MHHFRIRKLTTLILGAATVVALHAGGPRLSQGTPPIPGLERSWVCKEQQVAWDVDDHKVVHDEEYFCWEGSYLLLLNDSDYSPASYDVSMPANPLTHGTDGKSLWRLRSLARLSRNGVVYGYTFGVTPFYSRSADQAAFQNQVAAGAAATGGVDGAVTLYQYFTDIHGDGLFSFNHFSLIDGRIPDWVCQNEGNPACSKP